MPRADPPESEHLDGAGDDEGPRPARTIGLDLHAASARYEGLVVAGGVETAVVAGLVAPQRRLLEAIYRLLDDGHVLEAQIPYRAQIEFMIVQKWLQLDPELHYPMWFVDDVRGRLALRNEVLREYGDDVLNLDTLRRYEQAKRDQEEKLERVCAERGVEVPTYPKLIRQAQEVGEAGAYALAYRYDSQSAVHPRALAVEQLLDKVDDGLAIRSEPHGPPLDLYAASAVTLLLALMGAADFSPDLAVPDLDAVHRELAALRT